ncbi:unnamed protein product [Moneuplotes crassus]|uniref:Uncharacterized protein n=1 Tax=Euplotes crassus TaxID=5936 RepID=A0AAD1XE12_EUPCR|nr:unnamed protein product [Moneuplotes crassus]
MDKDLEQVIEEAKAVDQEEIEEEKEGEEPEIDEEERKALELNEKLEMMATKLIPKKYSAKTTFQVGSEEKVKEVFSAEFGFDDKYLAVALGDATICIYNLVNNKLAQSISYVPSDSNDVARAMCVKWLNNAIICAFSDGVVNEYSCPVGKLVSSVTEENNQTFVLDVDPYNEKFCTGGKDYRVRVYDAETKECLLKMIPVDSKEPGHAQRIFAMTYKRDDPNVVITGGWDKTLQIHDIRRGGPVGYIFGPDLSSNSIDIYDNTIATGSYRGRNPLQIWDLRKKDLISNIEWDYSGEASENSFLNCAAFTHNGEVIIAGGKGEEIKYFDLDKEEDVSSYSLFGKQSGFDNSILCCAFAKTNNNYVVGTADGTIKIFN